METREDLTVEEEAGLRELGEELQAARSSHWQPAAVAKAFGERGKRRLTMQGWIELDWVRSPLLEGKYPGTMGEIEEVFRAFGERREGLAPEETVERIGKMKEAIEEGFAALMTMAPPDGEGGEGRDAGMGNWLPMVACLVGEMGIGPAAALALPVGQALALIAALRANQGWMPRRDTYRDREA